MKVTVPRHGTILRAQTSQLLRQVKSYMRKLVTGFVIAICLGSGIVLGACDNNQSTATHTSRFILNEGEAFDQKTKLTWRRCGAGSTWEREVGCVGRVKIMSLERAKQLALNLGDGWRVPTIEELYSIVEQTCINPAVNVEVFPSVKNLGEGAPYWSVTKVEELPSLFYYVDFINGDVDGHSRGYPLAVRFVRSLR